MRRDHLEKINSWFMEQIEGLKGEGASEQELNDPAVADLALRKIFEEHFDDIRTDPDLTDETFAMVSNQASPDELREIAVQAREEGGSKLGHYLDMIAGFRAERPL
jgi:hypothetical protein